MISPKPLSERLPAKQPLRKPRRMTIAIGMFCNEGLIIAADTQITMSDGTTRYGSKVHQAIADTGVYVTANSSEDGNAANTLIPDMFTELQNKDPKSFAQVEKIVRASMAEWASKYPQQIPNTQILLGASIDRTARSEIKTGGGLQLYHCEPPDTMLRVDCVDANSGYCAIGAGSTITDPIFRSYFGTECSANIGFQQIAYLMYRAKRDAAGVCGGETNAVLLKDEFSLPQWVQPLYMNVAEGNGFAIDFCIKMAACAVFAEADEAAAILWDIGRPHIVNQGKLFRSQRFLTQSGEDVGLSPHSTLPKR